MNVGEIPLEMKAMARLCHPNIVQLHEVIEDQQKTGLVFIMQYLDGTNLNELEELPINDELRKWARQLISALHMCHVTARVCHRDIKPENLKVDSKTKDLILYDFGASQCFEGENDRIYDTAGSYAYFAPEQLITGPKVIHGRKVDVWATGVTLYQIATGRNPFMTQKGVLTLFKSIKFDEVDYSSFGDQLMVKLLKKMLEKDPEKRSTIENLVSDEWLTNHG